MAQVYPNPPMYGDQQQYGMQYGQPQTVTNVVVQAAPQPVVLIQLQKNWSTSLCGCCSDCCVCFAGFFFPWCYTCHLASEMNESCCVGCCTPGALIAMRTKIRTKENIVGDICNDTCLYMYCHPCALTQLGREVKAIKARGGSI